MRRAGPVGGLDAVDAVVLVGGIPGVGFGVLPRGKLVDIFAANPPYTDQGGTISWIICVGVEAEPVNFVVDRDFEHGILL